MHILVLHRYFWPENVSVLPLMLREVVRIHEQRGDTVHVICGCSEKFETQWEEAFSANVTFEFFLSPIDRKLNVVRRILNSARLLAKGAKAIAFGRRIDLLYVISYPPMLAGLVGMVGRLSKKPKSMVYYIQDNLMYRVPTALGRKAFRFYQRIAMKMADRTITLSDEMKSELLSYFSETERSAEEKKVCVIPNYSTDLEIQTEATSEKSIDIIYAGNHGLAQNLFYFIDLLSNLSGGIRPSVAFFGDGTEKPKLIEHARNQGVDIAFHDSVGRDEIKKQMAGARLGLVGAQKGLMRFAFPSKLAAYNSAGTKGLVMCEDGSQMSAWIAEHQLGFTLDPVDKSIATNELEALMGSSQIAYSTDQVFRAASEVYGAGKYIERMRELVESLDK